MSRNLTQTATPDQSLSAQGLAAIDAYLQGLIDKGTVVGFVTLAARHGQIARISTLGVKDLVTGEPMAADTMFRIFSMTKPVTAVAMMILHDRGLWSPDDPIAKHLPEFEGVKVLAGFDASGAPILEEADHPPTLRELMTHTAGFTYARDPADAMAPLYAAADVWGAPNLAEFSKRLAILPLAYQPGGSWLYSLSMDLQAVIVEKLSGQPLADFYQDHIFGPLGMVDTHFYIPPQEAARMATLYRASASRGLLAMNSHAAFPDRVAQPTLPSGGGGLISTVTDYAHFAQMLLNQGVFGDSRIISTSAAKLMMTNHLSDQMLAIGWGAAHQRIRPGFGQGFNGIVFTDPVAAGVPVGTGTYHWDGAASTWFWVDPANDLIFVGMVQLLISPFMHHQEATQTLMAGALVSN